MRTLMVLGTCISLAGFRTQNQRRSDRSSSRYSLVKQMFLWFLQGTLETHQFVPYCLLQSNLFQAHKKLKQTKSTYLCLKVLARCYNLPLFQTFNSSLIDINSGTKSKKITTDALPAYAVVENVARFCAIVIAIINNARKTET
ncbi:hypothetical protein HanRHA438_Chr14g0667261 [Helianthus annuus]|nr:hypothetical protein HanHA300_Chr14g0534691 [Helianthus annuus]KAJ0486699.1 hypothetical protein HanHA89_Chr14g0582491 [Helianthus annuus]KAJ0854868.1 hypothetical protein HanRHA438_Chr14g0667261 [Helianthus annuus]